MFYSSKFKRWMRHSSLRVMWPYCDKWKATVQTFLWKSTNEWPRHSDKKLPVTMKGAVRQFQRWPLVLHGRKHHLPAVDWGSWWMNAWGARHGTNPVSKIAYAKASMTSCWSIESLGIYGASLDMSALTSEVHEYGRGPRGTPTPIRRPLGLSWAPPMQIPAPNHPAKRGRCGGDPEAA